MPWKTLKKVLEYELGEPNLFPKELFKEFYKKEIITDLDICFKFLKIRYITSHMYSENFSYDAFSFIEENYKIIGKLIKNLKDKLSKDKIIYFIFFCYL